MNETRAGSITLQLQETIRAIKRYPDALQQVHLGISNAEARIGTVEQTATHRIEVIRAEMSWALHDHKERTDRLIDQLSPEVCIRVGIEIPDGTRYEVLPRNASVSGVLSRQILWLLYDFLRPHVTGDSTFKRIDLVELDVQLWDRDDSVRNYAYLRTIRVNAMTTWRRRRNQEKMCILPHDPRQHNGGMLPLHMAVRIDRHHDLREVRVLQDDVIRGVAARIGRRLRDAFRRGVGLLDSRGVLVLAGLRLRVLESTPSLLSPGKRCKELGYRFIWEPFCDPMFFDPKGKRLKIDVINNIPYLLFSETDLPRVYPALPAPIIVHEKVVAVGEAPQGELDEIGELVLDMPQEEKGGPRSSGDKRDVGSNLRGLLLLLLPSLGLTI
eukprot:s519_g22.t1